MDRDWSVDETINQIKHLLLEKDYKIERLREALKFYKCSCTEEQFKTCNEYMCGHKAQAALKDGE